MAITEVKLDILGADLGCAELRPNFDTGLTTVGAGGSANAEHHERRGADFSGLLQGSFFPRTPNRFVQSFTPSFAADGSISTLVPLCYDVVNGVQSGITLTSVLARTVGQDSFQTQRHEDRFDIELFDFGAVPDPNVEIDITAENLFEIPQQIDFQGSVFNAPCTPIFLTLNDDGHTQLFRGFHCTVNGQVFRSAAKFLLGSLVSSRERPPRMVPHCLSFSWM